VCVLPRFLQQLIIKGKILEYFQDNELLNVQEYLSQYPKEEKPYIRKIIYSLEGKELIKDSTSSKGAAVFRLNENF